MCAIYTPPTRPELASVWAELPPLFGSYEGTVFPGMLAPLIPNMSDGMPVLGSFRILPDSGVLSKKYETHNAKLEDIKERKLYKGPWERLQLGIVPARSFYEPCYDTGRAVRWRIERADGELVQIPCIWRRAMVDDRSVWSFSLLTLDATDHPVMHRFHEPAAEKRSILVLDRDECEGWLRARSEAEARSYWHLPEADLLVANADPLPSQIERDRQGGLF